MNIEQISSNLNAVVVRKICMQEEILDKYWIIYVGFQKENFVASLQWCEVFWGKR